MFPPKGRFAAALTACVMFCPASAAQAREVLVVSGKAVAKRDYRFVPAPGTADLGPEPRAFVRAASPVIARAATARGGRAVSKAIRKARVKQRISRSTARRYNRIHKLARGRYARLGATRKRELGGVIANLESVALRGQLTAPRMPALFLIVRRNAEFWPRSPLPASGGYITFRRSELLFEYYPGEGLQLQPLVNFKKANALHGACVKGDAPCRKRGLKLLLREMVRTSARRGGFRAWEYYFDFGGGSPPWISGMATATGIQAFGRASQLLGIDRYRAYARQSFRAFGTPPPVGVATSGPLGGTHYLQYSFAPRLYIINALLQTVIGLYDYAEITGDKAAERLYGRAEPTARRELPRNDTGDWSTYSFGGAESTREYHELLRELAASLCSRLDTKAYCGAARNFRSYTTKPARLELLGPEVATKGRDARVRFSLSKLSAVQLTISRAGKVVYDRTVTLRRGEQAFIWKPRSAGEHTIRLAAKELRTGRALRSRESAPVNVAAR